MFVYTTCRDCGGLLQVTNEDTVHPTCTPRPTRYERLMADFVAAAADDDRSKAEELEMLIGELDSAPPDLKRAALVYASWGWPVFPLLPLSVARTVAEQEGIPLSKAAKRPGIRGSFQNATSEPGWLADWWDRHPDSNIAVATGHWFDVIDIDPRHGGMDSYRTLLAEEDPKTGKGVIPAVHGKVATPGGGWHLYVKPIGDCHVGIRPGIDIRGRGGYVAVPPSQYDGGYRWEWIVKPSPEIRQ